MNNRIADINEEFFGDDKHKDYLINDYHSVLFNLVQREVIMTVLKSHSKARKNQEVHKDHTGEIVSIHYGDFDPNNAAALSSIAEAHQMGTMASIRLLFEYSDKKPGRGSFIKFISDISDLSVSDFIDYYSQNKTVPRSLKVQYEMSKLRRENVSPDSLVSDNLTDIADAVEDIKSKSNHYIRSGYKNKIIDDYQSRKFHKDRQPIKHDVSESERSIREGFTVKHTTRRSLATFELGHISKSIEDMANIMLRYQELVTENTDFKKYDIELDRFVRNSFSVLSGGDIETADHEVTIVSIHKNIPTALRLVGWDKRG